MFVLLISQLSFAAIDTIGAISTATGGGGRGAVEPTDGLLLNPAFIRDLPGQNFSFNYSPDQWALSLSDSGEDAYFPAALVLVNQKTDLIDTQKLGIVLAAPRWKRFVIGANTSLVEYTDKMAAFPNLKYRQGVVDIGATLNFGKIFAIGLVANNIGSTNVDLNESLQVQKSMGIGLSYTMGEFARFRFDMETAPENKTDRMIYMLGLENYMNEWVVFRVGFQNNQVLSKDYITAGLGFAGPQFTLHYAYISDTANQTDQKHLFDLGIPF